MTPVNESLMSSLKKRYGEKKGEEIYYKMESEGKIKNKGDKKKDKSK